MHMHTHMPCKESVSGMPASLMTGAARGVGAVQPVMVTVHSPLTLVNSLPLPVPAAATPCRYHTHTRAHYPMHATHTSAPPSHPMHLTPPAPPPHAPCSACTRFFLAPRCGFTSPRLSKRHLARSTPTPTPTSRPRPPTQRARPEPPARTRRPHRLSLPSREPPRAAHSRRAGSKSRWAAAPPAPRRPM